MKPCQKCGTSSRAPSGQCRRCRNASTRRSKKRLWEEAKAERVSVAFGEASLRLYNPHLAPGTIQHRRVLAGGGFVNITEVGPLSFPVRTA